MSQAARDAVDGAMAMEAVSSRSEPAAHQPLHIDTSLFHDRVLPGLQESAE